MGWGDGLAKIPAKKNFPCETPCENPCEKRKKKIHLFLNIKYLILQHKYLPHDLRDVW